MWLAPLLLLGADVLDVDATQGPFTEIRDAVAVAQDGDVIRVAPGSYGWFGVFGKSLEIKASGAPGSVSVQGTVRVQDLAADGAVVLHGLDISLAVGDIGRPLIVANCAGAVRVQDCAIVGENGAVQVLDALDVTFDGLTLDAAANFFAFIGTSAVHVERSSLTMWACSARGSSTSLRSWGGGAGIHATDSELFLHDTTAVGGQGGPDDWDWWTQTCDPAGDGGPGVRALGGTVRILASALIGGAGGIGFDCFLNGADGPALSTSSGTTVIQYPGDALRFECPALVPESSPVTITASGEPADTIVLVIGPGTGRVALPAYVGDLHVGGPIGAARRTLLGTGSTVTQLQMPALAPFEVEPFFLQTVHFRAGQVHFGPTRSLTVLDSAW